MLADHVSARVREALEYGRVQGRYSGASWAWGSSKGLEAAGRVGAVSVDDPQPVTEQHLFDLASVTKPLVALALLRRVDRGDLRLDQRVGEVLTDWPDTPMARTDLRSLLTHTSGAPGPTPLFREHPHREDLLAALSRLPVDPPGQWRYSSMGYITLGLAAEHATGMRLDDLLAQEVLDPCGMTRTRYGPVPPELAVATEDCPWRGHVVRGSVHDENAEVLGGIAGHAGLFGTADDLGRLATILLRGGFLAPDTERAMWGKDDGRPLGWWSRERCTYLPDTASERAVGHTGFTGTSLVLDPERDRWVCLLANRVHPSREPRGFEQTRAAVHALAFGPEAG